MKKNMCGTNDPEVYILYIMCLLIDNVHISLVSYDILCDSRLGTNAACSRSLQAIDDTALAYIG